MSYSSILPPEILAVPYLTAEDKAFFKENGYLIKHDTLTDEQIQNAQDALWEGIEADRDDPETWVNAGLRSPASGPHPAIHGTVMESPIFEMAEELVGKGKLNEGGPGPALVFPSGDEDWDAPERGHLDGYYTPNNGVPEGTVGLFHVGTTIYVEHVEPRGAGFTVWPGTHRAAGEYFKTHSLLSVQGGVFNEKIEFPEPVEITGPPGTVCLWHGQLVHSGSKNCRRRIRMALIGRLARKDVNNIRFESPNDIWEYWEGID